MFEIFFDAASIRTCVARDMNRYVQIYERVYKRQGTRTHELDSRLYNSLSMAI